MRLGIEVEVCLLCLSNRALPSRAEIMTRSVQGVVACKLVFYSLIECLCKVFVRDACSTIRNVVVKVWRMNVYDG